MKLRLASFVELKSEALILKILNGAITGGIIKAGGMGLAFLFFLGIARSTDSYNYGIFASAFSLATIVGYASTVGQHTSILRFWPELEEKYGRQTADSAALRGLVTVFLGCLCLLGVSLIADSFSLVLFGKTFFEIELFWIGVLGSCFSISEYVVAVLRSRGSIVVAFAPREILWRILVLLMVLCLWVNEDLSAKEVILMCTISLAVVTGFQLIYLIYDRFDLQRVSISAEVKRRIDVTTFAFWGHAFVGPINAHIATVIAGIMLGPQMAGAFFAADRLAKLIALALTGINMVLGPALSRSFHSGKMHEVKLMTTMATLVSILFSLSVLACYVFFGEHILGLFDESYRAVYFTLIVLSVGQVINSSSGPNGMLLQMAGMEREFLKVVFFWGVILVITTYMFTALFGLIGCAFANAITLVGWNVSALLIAKKKLGVSMISFDIDIFNK